MRMIVEVKYKVTIVRLLPAHRALREDDEYEPEE